jgi:two-component system, OmpR family, sensor histidine kinase TctE
MSPRPPEQNRTRNPWSISRRLILILLLPLAALLAVSVLSDYQTALRPAHEAYDQGLADAALAVAAHLQLRDGRPRLDLTPLAESILRSDRVDQIYYLVTDAAGTVIAGDQGLPQIAPGRTNPSYGDARYRGQSIRGVHYRVPSDAGPITVVVAETTRKRENVAQRIVTAMVVPNLLLIVATLVLVVFGVPYGLAPLARLRAEIEARSARDLHALPLASVPAEVQPLVRALNHLFGLVEQSSAGQQRFLADAAHQLRTPLAALQTQLELAALDDNPETRGERLRTIEEATRRVSHLVNQLLALAKSEPTANFASQSRNIDLREIVEAAASTHLDRAIANDIDLGFEPEHTTIRGVPWLVRELLANLIENAIAYTPRGGTVTVRCGGRDGRPFVEVEDNGPGIAPEERSKVFGRFYRVPGTVGDGCGLGLAIVKEIAEVHGAAIDIGSPDAGPGTRVTVSFPPVDGA